MSDEWKPYPNDRVCVFDDLGFVVIKPRDASPGIPLACPVCSFLLRSKDDERSYRTFAACDRCSTVWAYANRTRWDAGWRPPAADVAADVAQRPPIVVTAQ